VRKSELTREKQRLLWEETERLSFYLEDQKVLEYQVFPLEEGEIVDYYAPVPAASWIGRTIRLEGNYPEAFYAKMKQADRLPQSEQLHPLMHFSPVNGWPCVFIVATSTIPTVVINLSHGVRSVDPELLEMARLYRFSRRKILLHVTLPSIRPYFFSALEIVVGGGWKLAVMGEGLTTNSGIGGAITTARLNIQPDAIIAWAFLLVAGCFITQKLVCLLLSRRGGAPC